MSTEQDKQKAEDEAMEKKSEDKKTEELSDDDLDSVAGGKKVKYDQV